MGRLDVLHGFPRKAGRIGVHQGDLLPVQVEHRSDGEERLPLRPAGHLQALKGGRRLVIELIDPEPWIFHEHPGGGQLLGIGHGGVKQDVLAEAVLGDPGHQQLALPQHTAFLVIDPQEHLAPIAL